MPEYTLVDPKTGAQIKAQSSVELTPEQLARKSAAYFSRPNPDPNQPMEGVAPSSPVVEQGKAVADFATSTALSAAGAAAGSEVLPTLGRIGRVAGAALGGMGGKTMTATAIEGRLPTTPELLLEAASSAMGEGAFKAVIKSPSENEEIGLALRRMAGVGDPMTKVGERGIRYTGDAASDLAASRSLLGRDILDSVDTIAKGINKHETKLFRTLEQVSDAAKVRVRIPGDAQQSAARAAAEIGDPKMHPDEASAIKMKRILNRIATFGQTPQGVQDLSVREFRKLQAEVRHLAPKFKDRLMPGDDGKGVLSSIQGQLSEELERAVQGTPAQQALADAKRYHEFTKVQFRENIVNAVKGKEGTYATIMDLFVVPDNPDMLRIAMQHMSPELAQRMRQSWLNNRVILKASSADGSFNTGTALKILEELSPETQNTLFGNRFSDVRKIMERMQREVEAESGILGPRREIRRDVARLSTFGVGLAGWSLYRGDFPTAAAALAANGGAIALSYILSHPTMSRWFARGLEAPPNTKIAIRFGAQILGHLPQEVVRAITQEPPAPGSQEDIAQISQRHKAKLAAEASAP